LELDQGPQEHSPNEPTSQIFCDPSGKILYNGEPAISKYVSHNSRSLLARAVFRWPIQPWSQCSITIHERADSVGSNNGWKPADANTLKHHFSNTRSSRGYSDSRPKPSNNNQVNLPKELGSRRRKYHQSRAIPRVLGQNRPTDP
jgi:hypothetical protein